MVALALLTGSPQEKFIRSLIKIASNNLIKKNISSDMFKITTKILKSDFIYRLLAAGCVFISCHSWPSHTICNTSDRFAHPVFQERVYQLYIIKFSRLKETISPF